MSKPKQRSTTQKRERRYIHAELTAENAELWDQLKARLREVSGVGDLSEAQAVRLLLREAGQKRGIVP